MPPSASSIRVSVRMARTLNAYIFHLVFFRWTPEAAMVPTISFRQWTTRTFSLAGVPGRAVLDLDVRAERELPPGDRGERMCAPQADERVLEAAVHDEVFERRRLGG